MFSVVPEPSGALMSALWPCCCHWGDETVLQDRFSRTFVGQRDPRQRTVASQKPILRVGSCPPGQRGEESVPVYHRDDTQPLVHIVGAGLPFSTLAPRRWHCSDRLSIVTVLTQYWWGMALKKNTSIERGGGPAGVALRRTQLPGGYGNHFGSSSSFANRWQSSCDYRCRKNAVFCDIVSYSWLLFAVNIV